jgi:6-phosphogluconolactonase
VDPTGRFLYTADSAASVTGFSINTSTGALTALGGSPFAAGTNTSSVAADPSGRFLYVADVTGDILMLSINSSNGALTLSRTILGRAGPSSIALATGTAPVTYTPKFAYAANSDANTISAYTTDAESGSLTPVPGSPFKVDGPPASDPQAVSVTVDPTGKFEYVAEFNGNGSNGSLAAYTINAVSGALTFTSGSPFTVGNETRSALVDPSGRFLYVANPFSDDISGFAISPATGNVSALSGSPYGTGMATSPWGLAIDPSGRFLCVTLQAQNAVQSYSIDPVSGNLTKITNQLTGTAPVSVVIDPTGRFVYVASADIYAYTISSTGLLAPMTGSPFTAGANPVSVAVDPSGRFLYTANQLSSDASGFAIDPNTGFLTPIAGSPFPADLNPQAVTVDPSGTFVYVANSGGNDVSAYTIDSISGALSANPGAPFAAGSFTFAITTTGNAH